MSSQSFVLDQQLLDDYIDAQGGPLQGYWSRVRAEAAKLDPEAAAYDDAIRKINPKHLSGFLDASQKACWMTSLKVPAKSIRGGRTLCCPPRLAARLIVDSTHRRATDAEVEEWNQEQLSRKELTRQLEAAKQPVQAAPVHHIHIGAEALQQAVRETTSAPSQGKGHGARPSQATD